ncbi:MAG: hypothetical protein RL653_4237 [Pseudomonadota bacterium]|jgi:hypothetical protein
MPATFALAVLSAAVGHSLRVRAWAGFEQPAVVWVTVAAASGENKSAVVNAMKSPISSFQANRRKEEQPVLEEALRRHALLVRQAEALAKRAASNKGDVSMDEAQRAMREADEAKPGPLFRLTFDSSTTEALVAELASHGFLAHLEGEGDVFTDIVGRYDSGGLLKQYLDAFDGAGIDLDRVGRGNISAERVLLVLGVMLQPDMLASVMREGCFKGRGLLERCLYAMPPTLVGRRDMRALEGRPAVELAYFERVIDLCRTHRDGSHRVLELSADGRELFVAYRARIEQRLSGDLASIVSWVNKAQGGIALRLAALLTAAWDPSAREISGKMMGYAVHVMEAFFIPQALRTFGDLRGDAAGHVANQVGPWLRAQDGVFTPRDLQRARGDLFPTADSARALLDQFVEEGVLEHVHRDRTRASGPKPQKGYRQVRQVVHRSRNPEAAEQKEDLELSADLSDPSDLSGGVTR